MLDNTLRIRKLNEKNYESGSIIYWMSRDQRVEDNWALIHAQELALKHKSNLEVVFCLYPKYKEAGLRQFKFMLEGLVEVEENLNNLNINLKLVFGKPKEEIPNFLNKINAGYLVSDFSPLREIRKQKKLISEEINIPFIEVDSHNVIPPWITSNKQEYSARTIRPKINNKLEIFLTQFPKLKKMNDTSIKKVDWEEAYKFIKVEENVTPVSWLKSGTKTGNEMLKEFLKFKASSYENDKNDPTIDGLSNLSPYLHFGQVAPQRVALETQKYEVFFEELLVRRELAENYCFYNDNYDRFKGLPAWGQKTLNSHKKDRREYTYTLEQFENYKTHDQAWNAAQKEMVVLGKMHGYMRMYWAKKILEWSGSPEEAMNIAIYLNDKYQLDGRDPNGYTGIAWSIGGLHDRPWFEREVYGTVRYMNYNGLKRKFKIEEYIKKIESL